MKITLAAGLIACALSAAAWDYKLEEREAIHHVFGSNSALELDNLNGGVTVTGDDIGTIRVEGEKIVRADDAGQMARGKQDVVLETTESGGVARLRVKYPEHQHYAHYEVTYNFTIRVPRAIALNLHTVNGSIETIDTNGHFDLHSVNGKVKMTNAAGSGSAQTVNGTTTAVFRESPKSGCEFKSVNGKLDVTFPANLSADISVSTVNGSAYTDFDTTALAPAKLKNNRLRVGAGGPEMKFETVNGSIQIRKKA